MKFKVDENLPAIFAAELRAAGFEADTVREERLTDAGDRVVFAVCESEGRVLNTEDLDFANVVAYPPESSPGIVVLRPRQKGLGALAAFRRLVLPNVGASNVGRLWIVEDDRVRVH